jgi:hypothetical protein
MTGPSALVEVASSFASRGVRWLVVGGYAVIAHGHVRLTHDLDIVLDLDDGNCRTALSILAHLGFAPRAPVDMSAFADPQQRSRWGDSMDMVVFTLWRQREGRFEQLDLFIKEPFDFDLAWQSRHVVQLSAGVAIPCVGLQTLLAMKRAAGRPRDQEDIANLMRVAR